MPQKNNIKRYGTKNAPRNKNKKYINVGQVK